MSQIVNEISDNISIITDSVSKKITNNFRNMSENLSEILSKNFRTLQEDINNNFSKLSEKSHPKWLQILITISCLIIIVLIFYLMI